MILLKSMVKLDAFMPDRLNLVDRAYFFILLEDEFKAPSKD